MTQSRLIRLPEVLEMVGFSQRTLYRKVEKRQFPQPITLSWDAIGRPRIVVWRYQDVLSWISSLGGKN